MTVSEVDLAWAAGFLDGEGSFMVRSNGYVAISCCQTDTEPLLRLQTIFDAGHISGPKTNNGRDGFTRRPHYDWEISREDDALRVATLLRPHMSRRRRDQIDRMLSASRGDPATLAMQEDVQ